MTTSLSPGQERALLALLYSKTLVEAAQRAEVSERSIRRWLAEDEVFLAEYRRARREIIDHAVTRLQSLTTKATEMLEEMLDDRGPASSARVAAVRTTFDYAYRGLELDDIATRLDGLEQSIQDERPVP